MKIEDLLALIDVLVDEKLDDIVLPQGKKGLRGLRGLNGDNGKDGLPGKDFIWNEHKDKIELYVKENQITFDKLTEDQKESIRGHQGKTGKKGLDGKSFEWEEHKLEIFKKIVENKLKFSDLTEDEVASIRGPRGLRGQKGKSGNDFEWDEYKDLIYQKIDENRLRFSDLTQDEKCSLKGDIGERGLTGKKGKDGNVFNWDDHLEQVVGLIGENKLRFSDLTKEEVKSLTGDRGLQGQKGKPGKDGTDGIDGKDFVWKNHEKQIFSKIEQNKIKFEDLTEEETNSLKGERGSRGQRGKSGSNGLSAYEVWLLDNKGSEKDFILSLKGLTGVPGTQGVQGRKGDTGKTGRDGFDGVEIIDIQLKDTNGKFYFVFHFSDGTVIETKKIDKPSIERIIQSTIIESGGGSGSGGVTLEIYKDNVLVGLTEKLNFAGDNITALYDEPTKTTTITVEEKCIPVSKDDVELTDCLNYINFCGDGVNVSNRTVMSDWATLTDVEPSMAGYEAGDGGFIDVCIDTPETASKLQFTKKASEDISKFQLVRLVSSIEVASCDIDSFINAQAVGIAINAATTGNDVVVAVFGIVEDPAFTFTVNDPLFLSSGGILSDTVPSTTGEFITVCGQSLGTGGVFIKISEPEEIL